MKFVNWITDRAKEKSTWLGITGILTAAGIAIAPDLQEAIISVGMAIAGLIAVITKEKITEVK